VNSLEEVAAGERAEFAGAVERSREFDHHLLDRSPPIA
jgi:hypothetical protein